jgi:Lon protease-like protein
MDEIGLFPLQLVLLPTERIPLHVFEERYKELIGECLEHDTEFGLVYADDDGLRDLGTRARVDQVLATFPDGRLNVLVQGGERFRLDELTTGRSFHTGLVSAIADEDDPAGDEAVARALHAFERLREVTGSEVGVPDAGAELLSFELAGKVELPADDKLELLGELSERRRLDRVADLLTTAVDRAERARLAAERAGSNGRVDLG